LFFDISFGTGWPKGINDQWVLKLIGGSREPDVKDWRYNRQHGGQLTSLAGVLRGGVRISSSAARFFMQPFSV
jgi:hypothetical protein